MRFRAFGSSGLSLSAISLVLRDPKGRMTEADWAALMRAGLENGVNSYEFCDPSPALLDAIGGVARLVERHLLFFSWRLDCEGAETLAADQVAVAVEGLIQRTGLVWLDAVFVDESTVVDEAKLHALAELRDQGRLRFLGVRGDGDGLEACIASGWFNCLATPYNVLSGWRERHRLKTASTRGMSIVGYDAYPASLAEAAKGPKLVRSSIWRRASDPQSGAGAYSFMGKTDGWTPQEICVAYALTEPSLSTVQVDAADPKRLAALAAVPERDLPSQVPAQIEMARFSAPPGGVERRRRA